MFPFVVLFSVLVIAQSGIVSALPDVAVDLIALQQSGTVDAVPMSELNCAKQEKCLSVNPGDPDYDADGDRYLLRFDLASRNVGTSPFLPVAKRADWVWMSCHGHYHSVAFFAKYEIRDKKTNKLAAQGAKASFCLMDSKCPRGTRPRYSCTGEQGISPGCSDVYPAGLDCQWIDVTDLKPGVYKFVAVINPGHSIVESSYANNRAVCTLKYTGDTGVLTQCHYEPEEKDSREEEE